MEGLGELTEQRLRAARALQRSPTSPRAQAELLELIEAETRAVRDAVAGASPYAPKPGEQYPSSALPLGVDGGSPQEAWPPERSRSRSRSRSSSPAERSPPGSWVDSDAARRVQFGAEDRTMSFHQSAAERLAQRGDEIVTVISGALDDGHASLHDIHSSLRLLDRAGSGTCDGAEFAVALEELELGLTVDEIDVLVDLLDARGSGDVDYRELLAALGSPAPRAAMTDGQPEEARPNARSGSGGADDDSAQAFAERVYSNSVDPHDPQDLQQLAAFNDDLERQVRRGSASPPPQPRPRPGAANPGRRPRRAQNPAQPVAAARRQPASVPVTTTQKDDLWECTFEPDVRPQREQVINRHGTMVDVPKPATSVRSAPPLGTISQPLTRFGLGFGRRRGRS